MPAEQSGYHLLLLDEEKSLPPSTKTVESFGGKEKSIFDPRSWSVRTCFLVALVHTSLVWLASRGFGRSREPSGDECTRKLSTWSPGLPLVEYETTTLDGEIYQTNPYRGVPTPEIDEAWQRISIAVPGVRISAEELEMLNKSTTTRDYHMLPKEAGGGYLGMLEVFHLLHCLDSLRQATYQEYYPQIFVNGNQTKVRVHTDHCIDILRLHLMCASDVTPVLFYDDPDHELPQPDFSTLHQCRKFDPLLDWSHSNDRALKWGEIGLHIGH